MRGEDLPLEDDPAAFELRPHNRVSQIERPFKRGRRSVNSKEVHQEFRQLDIRTEAGRPPKQVLASQCLSGGVVTGQQ